MTHSPAPRRRPIDDARRPRRRAEESRPAKHRARGHRANGGAQQWRVQVDPDRAEHRAGRRRRRRAPAPVASAVPRRSLLAGVTAVFGVAVLGVVGAIAMDMPRDTEEVLTADQTPQPAPVPLPADVRGEMIQRHLRGVPVPFPRNVEIHDRVAETQPRTEADVIEAVNGVLHSWNLTPDGKLVHNNFPPHARACVDVDNRLAWLQEDGRITRGPVPTTTGMPGYESPRGEFTVQRKVRDEISYVFENEPMPFSVYFTTTGVAFHQGDLTQDSHGCIHLSEPDAAHFFDVLKPNDVVVTF